MENDQSMDQMVKKVKIGRGRRVAIAAVAVIVVALLLGVVVVGFRGRHILRNSAAMTTPVPASTNVGGRP
jgi:serine acetyltransferase